MSRKDAKRNKQIALRLSVFAREKIFLISVAGFNPCQSMASAFS
jgi:hypothetical protein